MSWISSATCSEIPRAALVLSSTQQGRREGGGRLGSEVHCGGGWDRQLQGLGRCPSIMPFVEVAGLRGAGE